MCDKAGFFEKGRLAEFFISRLGDSLSQLRSLVTVSTGTAGRDGRPLAAAAPGRLCGQTSVSCEWRPVALAGH